MGQRGNAERKSVPLAARPEDLPGRVATGAEGPGAGNDLVPAIEGWRETLRSVRASVDGATQAVVALRATLLEMAPLWRSLGELEQALKSVQWEEPSVATAGADVAPPEPAAVDEVVAPAEEPTAERGSAAEKARSPEAVSPPAEPPGPGPDGRLAERETVSQEADVPAGEAVEEAEAASVGAFSEPRHPLPAEGTEQEAPAPHRYTITVEDPGCETPLIPLYRALGRLGRIRDMDLVSYTNGVAVVSVESDDEIAGDDLRDAIAEAMDRECRIFDHEPNAFVVRMEPSR